MALPIETHLPRGAPAPTPPCWPASQLPETTVGVSQAHGCQWLHPCLSAAHPCPVCHPTASPRHRTWGSGAGGHLTTEHGGLRIPHTASHHPEVDGSCGQRPLWACLPHRELDPRKPTGQPQAR